MSPQGPQPGYVPLLQPRLCDWSNRSGREITCFELVVPENRRLPTARQVRLPIVIFRAPKDRVDDPVIFINGGPGVHSSTAGASARWWNRRIKQLPFLHGRDLIVFDQRGVGGARPALECPGVKITRKDPLNSKLLRRVLTACAKRLRGRGIDLAAYDTRATVADIVDLRRALKAGAWNLWGQSYGSRVALELMRRHPKGIRSVILDGPYPPHIGRNFHWAAPTIGTIRRLLQACNELAVCKDRLGAPRDRWVALLRRLRAKPLTVVSKPGGRLPPVTFKINDVMLLWVIQDSLYTSAGLRRLPALIAALNASEPHLKLLKDAVQDYDLNVYGPYYSHGAAYTVSCNDNPQPNKDEERRIAKRHPHLKPWIDDMLSVDGCLIFAPKAKATMSFEPVRSAIPTMLVSGGLDLATPPTWAKDTAKYLTRAYLFIFPNASHDASDLPCAQKVMRAFLDNPAVRPADGCTKVRRRFTFDWRGAGATQ